MIAHADTEGLVECRDDDVLCPSFLASHLLKHGSTCIH